MADKLTSSPRLNNMLHKMGIWTNYDVIEHLPRRYVDFSYTKERGLVDKERVVLYAKVITVPTFNGFIKAKLVTFTIQTSHNTSFSVFAFNRPYLTSVIKINEWYTFSGIYDGKRNQINLVNFTKEKIDENNSLKPVYALPSEYPNYSFITLVKKSLLELHGRIYSDVPIPFRKKYRLLDKEKSLYSVHFPKNYEDLHYGFRHLKYEEALMFSLKNQLIREENKSFNKIKKEPIDLSSTEAFLKTLPYTLTEDQKVASEEIINDMNQSSLMYRLLQGDVGTGKTLVCFVALFANYVRGDQGALMAPTDALAKQHYKNALSLFKDTKLKIALLVGSTPLSEKRKILSDLEDGLIDIVIGTHALFSKSVNYSSLGLAIIDEQHRFGVNQRLALADKGNHTDLLMMSATPIPRSLALTLYGDLDISTLYTFPSKKREVKTMILEPSSKFIHAAIENSLANNKQVYIVAPLIMENEGPRHNVNALFEEYQKIYHDKVNLLHGKMKNEEKEAALKSFYDGSVPILISTQVIEVGIDVKAANLIIIYDANSFGLASLHQLRGRVGRDGSSSKCLLVINDEDDEEDVKRLDVLTKSEDGFEIAEADLKHRGPGELSGLKQSGIPDFRYLNAVEDIKIFLAARDDAKEIIKDKHNPDYRYVLSRADKEIKYNPIKGA